MRACQVGEFSWKVPHVVPVQPSLHLHLSSTSILTRCVSHVLYNSFSFLRSDFTLKASLDLKFSRKSGTFLRTWKHKNREGRLFPNLIKVKSKPKAGFPNINQVVLFLSRSKPEQYKRKIRKRHIHSYQIVLVGLIWRMMIYVWFISVYSVSVWLLVIMLLCIMYTFIYIYLLFFV